MGAGGAGRFAPASPPASAMPDLRSALILWKHLFPGESRGPGFEGHGAAILDPGVRRGTVSVQQEPLEGLSAEVGPARHPGLGPSTFLRS
jgi:hypothetical protein